MNNSDIIQRYPDVIFALHAASRYDQSLGRIQLQKFIYLGDILSIIWHLITAKEGHETYNFGPYDPKIQNAADILSFRGFINIRFLDIVTDPNKTTSQYSINNNGLNFSENLCRKQFYNTKNHIYQNIALNVNRVGWGKLKTIVYSEITYLNEMGHYRKIDSNSYSGNKTYQLLELFDNLTSENNQNISKENMVSIFFKIIENYIK